MRGLGLFVVVAMCFLASPMVAGAGEMYPGSRIDLDRLVVDAELAVVGRPVAVRREKLFYPDEWASTLELCVVEVEVAESTPGAIGTNLVDLWLVCDDVDAATWFRNPEHPVETIWFLASRLQGLAIYGRRLEDDEYGAFPYATDTLVLQSMFSIWQRRAGGEVTPGGVGHPVCLEKGRPEKGEQIEHDFVVWCNGVAGDFEPVWEALLSRMASKPSIDISGKE